jgi:NAD(P)-dependent dehydrogenase (short-subunit alcohol dehydrogenase family)
VKTLQGKRVLVTGGASGIGRAIAERCAAAGAEIVLVDLNEAALREVAAALERAGSRVRT